MLEENEFDEDTEPPEPDIEAELDEDEEFSEDLDEEDLLVEEDEETESLEEAEAEDEEDETLDLEEELHPDDVEEPLDVLLMERTAGLLDEEDYEEDEDDADTDERTELGSRIPPKRPGEFVCRSCFLVKHPSQLADSERLFCRDCV
jgi:hypothetical protein